MISVNDALSHLFALCQPVGRETVALREANGRVLAADVIARREQPPFSASAMDGYGVRDQDTEKGAQFTVIGESAAGHGYSGTISKGEAVRIFTGAPIPMGVDRVIIQEDIARDGDVITLTAPVSENRNIRPSGGDFKIGDTITAPRRLSPRDLALIASMNAPEVTVSHRPDVVLIATGDELVMPGDTPGPDQIISSNSFGLAALIEDAGGIARMLPIAPDSEDILRQTFEMAQGADLIVTIGGASVGDHDLVGKVAAEMGLDRAFYKVAMRPGKPLMAGRMGESVMLGLPGNPVSAMVTAQLFLIPMLKAMQGLPAEAAPREQVTLLEDISSNGPREHYMRATVTTEGVAPFSRQDSSLLSILSDANALLVRPPHDPARSAGDTVEIIRL
ncbi:molybdopterin molybdotransferase MoeA [Celeribacter litoreus]|uniref:molybdopterin molybdotransferase MoeA n=1 Tax=Celeribacter litoreus TaxID=2876714 RepID=UPI001CCA3719|nr:gephyrin-like molybdotransferase Glp [Celeribacter litoreus]MCA0044586.1 molybdopterin molybdotransferase MoeA [Celeribacter litoreus]